MLHFLSLLLLILVSISLGYYLFSFYTINGFFQHKNLIYQDFYPPISILKPLYGLEINLEQYLTSFIEQDYPEYQIIFCVRDKNDPVIPLVKELLNKFPQHNLKLVINDRLIGCNYKVSNLANGLPYCLHDLILIADSDIEVQKDYLRSLVLPLQEPKIGLVTCLYQSNGVGIASILESLNVIGNFIPSVLTAQKVEGIKYAFGSTILIRKKVLHEMDNFTKLANSLADDFLLGNLATELGYQVALSNYFVEHHTEKESLREYLTRQIRWYRCIKVQRRSGYFGLLLTQAMTISLFLVLINLGSLSSLLIFSSAIIIKLILVYYVGQIKLNNKTIHRFFFLIPIVDLLNFYIWLVALFTDKIKWRDQEFTLNQRGELSTPKKS